MTLSRKIILRNGALVVGLLVLAGVSLTGLSGLRSDVMIALDEYNDLQSIEPSRRTNARETPRSPGILGW